MFTTSSARRAFRLLIAGVVALAVSFGVVATPASAAKRPVSVSFSVTKVVVPGGAAVLKGVVKAKATKKGVRKAKVVIQRKSGKKWAKVATVRTNGKGKFRYKIRNVKKATTYRAVVKKSKRYAKNISKVRKVKMQQGIAIASTGATTITAGDLVTVTGSVTKGLRRKKLVLQQRSDSNTWLDVRAGVASADGKFTLSGTVYGAGERRAMRVVSPTKKGVTAASRSWSVNVYGWFYLSDTTPKYSRNWVTHEPITIYGNYFPKSVTMIADWGSKGREYTLTGKCTDFRASVGIADQAETGLTARFEVFKDGVEARPSMVKKVGQTPTVMTASVAGAFRIVLYATKEAPDWQTYGSSGFGNARVRCLTAPTGSR